MVGTVANRNAAVRAAEEAEAANKRARDGLILDGIALAQSGETRRLETIIKQIEGIGGGRAVSKERRCKLAVHVELASPLVRSLYRPDE